MRLIIPLFKEVNMSKQGDLAIQKALTNIWGKPYDVRYTYNVFHNDH